MIRKTIPTLCLLLMIVIDCHAQKVEVKRSAVPEKINEKFLDKKLKPEEWVNRFEVESREVYSSRNEIVKVMKIKPGADIADVGAGTGLFMELFSKAASKKGKVYELDISPRLIEHLKKRVKDNKFENVQVVFSREDSLMLPENSVDIAFICDTYHHFEYHERMLESIFKSLRPGGELILIDFERISGTTKKWIMGHVRAGKEEFKKEVLEAGFQFKEEIKLKGIKENYILRFERP